MTEAPNATRRRFAIHPAFLALGWLLAWGSPVGASPESAQEEASLPTSPWQILHGALPRTSPIDAPPFCVPPDLEPPFLDLALESPSDFSAAEEQVRLRLAELRDAGDPPGPALALLAALLAGRSALDPHQRRVAAEGVTELLRGRLPPRAEACARLELARLQLWLGLHPEAAAQATLAARLRGRARDPSALSDAADFVRAEALYGARRFDEASPLYRSLARSESERLAAAARLRLADTRVDQGHLRGAWVHYEGLLPHAAEFGADPEHWAVRAAEALLSEGDLEAGIERLERHQASASDPAAADLARIRIADVLAAQGRLTEARDALAAVAEAHPDEPAGWLAEARAIALDVDARDLDVRIERMERVARAPNRGLSLYARSVRADLLLQRQRFAEALDELTRLAFEDPGGLLTSGIAQRLDRALLQLTDVPPDLASCTGQAEQLGWRRAFLLRQATDPEPFLRLGACYEQLGFATTAVELYREVAKRYPRQAGGHVAFPLARAALAAGDVPVARASAEAYVRRGDDQSGEWRLLLAEAQIADQRDAAALEHLRQLVSEQKPAGQRLRSILQLARVAGRLRVLPEERKRLTSAIDALSETKHKEGGEALGEAALLTAETHRQAEALGEAHRFYELARSLLPPGTRREEAQYWIAQLEQAGGTREQREDSEGRASPSAGGWSRLREGHEAVSDLRVRTGIAAPAAPAEETSR